MIIGMPRRKRRCDRAEEITCTPLPGDAAVRPATPVFVWISSTSWQMMLWHRGPTCSPRTNPPPPRCWARSPCDKRPTSGFTLGATACACGADGIATMRCIGPVERTQMPSACIYDFCHDDLPAPLC